MRIRSKGSLRALACALLLAGMAFPLSADDEPSEEATIGITVQLPEEGIVESAIRQSETSQAIPARVRFLQQLDPQADVLTLEPPAHAFWITRGMQMPQIQTAPMQVLMLQNENSQHPVIIRVSPQLIGGDGLFANFYAQATEEGGDAEGSDTYEPGDYMIGVSLSVIDSEVLRRHLSIEEGVGLIVDEVFENSPAQSAGVEVGDILLQVGETVLTSPEALVEAVQAYSVDAGEALTLEVIQAGERKTLTVTPITRQELLGYDLEVVPAQSEIAWRALVHPGHEPGTFDQLMVVPHVAWAQAQTPDNGLAASIQSLSEQVARLQEAIDRLEERLDDE